jgi:glycine cleavage system regulatory protein
MHEADDISADAKTDPIVAILMKMGVPPASVSKVKTIFKDLKDGKVDIEKAKAQLDATEKEALAVAFLKVVSTDDTSLISSLARAIKGVADAK